MDPTSSDQGTNPTFVGRVVTPWYLPNTPPLLANEERSPSDVEKAVEHILGDLKGNRIGKVTAERIRDAASGRVKQVESDQSFHRAIKGDY